MNWTTEVPKESGWYWVKFTDERYFPKYCTEVIYLLNGDIFRAGYEEFLGKEEITLWGDKLEIPE